MSLRKQEGYWLWTGGPVPRGSAAITLGNLVIVRRERVSPRLLRHELVHVAQFRRLGAPTFLAAYLWHYLRWRLHGYPHAGAYRRIPMEIEAYWLERQTDIDHHRMESETPG